MAREALKPSLALAKFLRSKREELGLSLRDVERKSAETGEPIPFSTLARVEQGKHDPGVRRLHKLLDLYRVPPHLVSDLIELEGRAGKEPPRGDLETLYREGVEHWRRGDIQSGLAYLFSVRQHVSSDPASRLLRQKAMLAFAAAARDLGRHRLAREVVEDLLCEGPDPSLVVHLMVLSSSVWARLGSLHAATAFAAHAVTLLPPNNPELGAWVYHQQSQVYRAEGDLERAETALGRAIDCYRAIGDSYGEARALLAGGRIAEARGDLAEAVARARRLIKLEGLGRDSLFVTTARIELGRLLVRTGAIDEGLAVLREGLGQAVALADHHGEFIAHYHLWKAYVRLEDKDRARFELGAARYFVRFVDDASPEANEIRKLVSEESYETRKRSGRRRRH